MKNEKNAADSEQKSSPYSRYKHLIYKSPLFDGISELEIFPLLSCLSASLHQFAKEEFIFMADDNAPSVGIVLSGGAYIIKEDYWGDRVILAHIGPGGMFGEAFSCAGTAKLPVSVVAAEKAEIMLIDYRKIVTTCGSACGFHTRIIMNMMRILAEKNILLTRKMEHLSKKTTREKLLSYLSAQATQAKSGAVEIPFNRQELADYLCVDRSALSRELGIMRREGLITYDKNRFVLIREE